MTMAIDGARKRIASGESDRPRERSDLQLQMKELSKEAHEKAEGKPFLNNLCHTHQVNERAYAQYLTDLLPVYQILEEGLTNNRELPYLSPLYIPEIFRAAKIAADLKVFNGEGIEQSAASINYQNHLREIGKSKPHLLIPHAYARYLGDLAGGQIIKKHVQQIWPGKANVLFYDFSEWQENYPLVKSPFGMMAIYRDLLNGLSLTDEQYREILNEVLSPFEYAGEMLDAIERISGWDCP